MNIYNGYLSGEERELMLETVTFEHEISKLNTLLSMVMLEEEQCIRDAEFKVFSESGTYDDFTYLVEEVEQQTAEKKQNIFARIWNAIKNFFKRIFGRAEQIVNTEAEEVEVPENYEAAANAITKAASDASGAVSTFFSNPIDGLKKLGIALGAITTVIGGTAIAMKVMPKDKADAITNKINSGINTLKGLADKVGNWITGGKSKDDHSGQEAGNIFARTLAKIDEFLKKVKAKVKDTAGAVKDAAQNVADKVTGKQKKIDAANKAESEQLYKNNVKKMKDKDGNTVMIDRTTGKKTYYDKDGNEIDSISASLKHDNKIDAESRRLKGKAEAEGQEKIDTRDQAEIDKHKTGKIEFRGKQTGGPTVAISDSGKIYIGGKPVKFKNLTLTPELDLAKALRASGVTQDGAINAILKAYRASKQGIKAADKEKKKINEKRQAAGMNALESVTFDDLFAHYISEAGYELNEDNMYVIA